MTQEEKQSIFNQLSELEADLFYKSLLPEDVTGISEKDLKLIHKSINNCLLLWHGLTGCTN